MKRFFILVIFTVLASFSLGAMEHAFSLGGGYFGETITYPGAVLNFEFERIHSAEVSFVAGTNLGFYVHQRSNVGIFLDVQAGFRRTFKKGFFLEQYLGLGTMLTFYSGDVYHVDGGTVTQISAYGNLDFTPSITLGAGWKFPGKNDSFHLAYLRPKMYWQMPVNDMASPHFALQVGYLYTFRGGQK